MVQYIMYCIIHWNIVGSCNCSPPPPLATLFDSFQLITSLNVELQNGMVYSAANEWFRGKFGNFSLQRVAQNVEWFDFRKRKMPYSNKIECWKKSWSYYLIYDFLNVENRSKRAHKWKVKQCLKILSFRRQKFSLKLTKKKELSNILLAQAGSGWLRLAHLVLFLWIILFALPFTRKAFSAKDVAISRSLGWIWTYR